MTPCVIKEKNAYIRMRNNEAYYLMLFLIKILAIYTLSTYTLGRR